jgi:uncharacterized cupredoxin-like copper-binding protein
MSHGAMSMDMGAHAAGVALPPGRTATLTYTFHAPGTLMYGCHVDHHYEAGMEGTIHVIG